MTTVDIEDQWGLGAPPPVRYIIKAVRFLEGYPVGIKWFRKDLYQGWILVEAKEQAGIFDTVEDVDSWVSTLRIRRWDNNGWLNKPSKGGDLIDVTIDSVIL